MVVFECVAQSAVERTFIQLAMRKCGGDQKKGEQLYTAYGSTGQVSSAGNVTSDQQIIYAMLECRVKFQIQLSVGVLALLTTVEQNHQQPRIHLRAILFMYLWCIVLCQLIPCKYFHH